MRSERNTRLRSRTIFHAKELTNKHMSFVVFGCVGWFGSGCRVAGSRLNQPPDLHHGRAVGPSEHKHATHICELGRCLCVCVCVCVAGRGLFRYLIVPLNRYRLDRIAPDVDRTDAAKPNIYIYIYKSICTFQYWISHVQGVGYG